MNIRRFLISLLAWATVATVFGASFDLIPVRNVEEGRNFTITFRLANAEASAPEGPELENCTLLFGPAVSTMSSTEIVNGKISQSNTVDYTFTYRADREGTVQIPVVTVRTRNGNLQSRAGSFRILPAENRGGSTEADKRGGNNNNQRNNDSQASGSNRSVGDDILVRVFFSKSNIYEQEPVVATIKLYTQHHISSFIPTVQPAFEGFLTEELPVANEAQIEHYNGRNYYTVDLKRLLLYPQRSGNLSVNSGRYNITIVRREPISMGFFSTYREVEQDVTTTSNAATITVRPLPSPKPADFSGAVGTFNVSTAMEPEILRTNEPAIYTYKVTGTGNIKYLSPVEMNFPAGMESYTPRTEVDTHLIGGGTNMSGSFTTMFTLVPTEVGTFNIEGKPFVYFDPSQSRYVTVNVDSMDVRILRGSGAAPTPDQPGTTVGTIDDILHIHPAAAESQSLDIHYTFGTLLYWLIFAISTLILIITVFLYRRNIKLNADVSGRRLAKAGRVAAKRLKAAKTAMDAHKPDQFYASLAAALWGYLSDKLGIPASQLTRDNIAGKLSVYGVEQADTDRLLDVLDRCEMARFTPAGSDSEMAGIYNQATQAINAIENVKRK